MGDGEKLLTYLNSAFRVLLGLDIFPRVPKKLNFVVQCHYRSFSLFQNHETTNELLRIFARCLISERLIKILFVYEVLGTVRRT
jgi:hypothetical protein